MNHYAARQIQDGPNKGKWHYTCHNDRTGTYAAGACAEDCPGHDTAEEAYEHERQRKLSQLVFRGPKHEQWPKNKCAVPSCQNEGTILADIKDPWVALEVCQEHANKDAVATLVRVGERWSS